MGRGPHRTSKDLIGPIGPRCRTYGSYEFDVKDLRIASHVILSWDSMQDTHHTGTSSYPLIPSTVEVAVQFNITYYCHSHKYWKSESGPKQVLTQRSFGTSICNSRVPTSLHNKSSFFNLHFIPLFFHFLYLYKVYCVHLSL